MLQPTSQAGSRRRSGSIRRSMFLFCSHFSNMSRIFPAMRAAKALLVVPIVLLSACNEPAAQPAPTTVIKQNRYQIVPDNDGGVWRLDTESGDMTRCTLGGDSSVHCTDAAISS